MRKSQVSLELILSFLFLTILLVGITKLFIWLNNSMVNRYDSYSGTLKNDINSGVVSNFYQPSQLEMIEK